MVVTTSTPQKEYASVVFLKWFTEAERNLRFSSLSGYLPVKKEANDIARLETALSVIDQKDVTEKSARLPAGGGGHRQPGVSIPIKPSKAAPTRAQRAGNLPERQGCR